MPELRNDGGALRLELTLAGREGAARATVAGEAPAPTPHDRLLVSAALEYLDSRDGEWWPLVRLPALYLPAGAVDVLLGRLSELLRGGEGFAWRPTDDAALAVQLSAAPGGAVVEIGMDLNLFLAESAGAARCPDAELALFRFRAGQADLVRFSDALATDLAAIPPR